MILHAVGPRLHKEEIEELEFHDFLYSKGGDWIWEYIQWDDNNLQWLVVSMQHGWLKWCVDGSYDSNVGPQISGAGWILYCTMTRKQVTCSLYEVQDIAS